MAPESVLVYLCYLNKIPQAGWLKRWTRVFSQFWRLEVYSPGVSEFGFWWELSPWLVDGHLLTVSSHGLSSLLAAGGESAGVSSSSYKDTNPIGSEPHP